jgi:hypothetical protein
LYPAFWLPKNAAFNKLVDEEKPSRILVNGSSRKKPSGRRRAGAWACLVAE